MSNTKLDIQKFGAGGTSWSAGITESAIKASYDSFCTEIAATEEAIRTFTGVDAALQEGWSGTDCTAYLDKFHTHAEDVCAQIEEYKVAVGKEVESIIAQWTEFQAGLIS